MSYPNNQNAKWYVELMERFRTLTARFGLPEDVASDIKVFLLETAKAQYMAGNRSGIRWAREQAGLPVRSSATS
ncbi:MAG: hypothetical protein Q8P30_04385 [Candidatus Uhrbacteria bacterium]|nr:hypothetical protein [Candidatus Uhrbacteria bacterium]